MISINNYIHTHAVYFFKGEMLQEYIQGIEKPLGEKHFSFISRQLSTAYILIIFLNHLLVSFMDFFRFKICFSCQNFIRHTMLFIGKFYSDGGSRIPFSKLLTTLAEKLPTEKIDRLKLLIQSKGFIDFLEKKKYLSGNVWNSSCFSIL